jgi:DNA-directed RNA polymerase specialized sigma24 family protein
VLRNRTDVPDDELAARSQEGDRQALETLIDRYRRFARAKGHGYFLIGGDADDIEQEALIGLYKAARDSAPSTRPASGPSPSCASRARSSRRSRPRRARSTNR